MTTVTEPPLIVPAVDVDDMPALDQPDERACQIPTRAHTGERPPAKWVMSAACGTCGARTLLACERCKRRFDRSGAKCDVTGERVTITRAEPL